VGGAKIFGVGLNKTGTRSLAAGLRQLGFRTLHKGDRATSHLVHRAHAEGRPLLSGVGEQFDAYLDVAALVQMFRVLDHQYPSSKFILTTREEEGWLASREKHVLANQVRRQDGRYDGQWLTVDRDAWHLERMAHHADVRAYFAARPDQLLVMDVIGGDGWSVLCPFLGVRPPLSPFPWENRAGAGTYHPLSVTARAMRVGRAVGRGLGRRVPGGGGHQQL
jgi:hypothetical protein